MKRERERVRNEEGEMLREEVEREIEEGKKNRY